MDLGTLLSDPVRRRVLGIALIFVSLFVFPQLTGVGPLAAVPTSVVIDAFSYNPVDNLLIASLTVFRGVETGDVVSFQLNLDPAVADQYGISADPVYLTVSEVNAQVWYQYQHSGSLPYVVCRTATGSDQIGIVYNPDDVKRAIDRAWNDYVARYGIPSGPYKVFVRYWAEDRVFLGGVVNVELLVCEYQDARFDLFSYKDKTVYSCFDMVFRNERGVAAYTDRICTTDVGAQVYVSQAGTPVGTIIYEGYSQLTWPPDIPVSPAAYLLVDRYKEANEIVTGVFLVDSPDKIDVYRSYADKLMAYIVADYQDPQSPNNLVRSAVIQLRGMLGPDYVILEGDGYPVTYSVGPSGVSFGTLSSLSSAAGGVLSDLLSNLVTNAGYSVGNLYAGGITIIKDVTALDRPLVSHRIRLTLNGEFVGVYFRRPVPRILSVAAKECTDRQCTISVRLRNDTENADEVGLVSVEVKGTYVYGKASVSFTSPGEETVVDVVVFPSGVESTVTDNITVTATAVHPLDPVKDTYSTSITIQKTATCPSTLVAGVCTFDENRGVWKFTRCADIYSEPETTYCPEGYACQSGTGCVPDVLQSVECTSSVTYVAHYQYSGDVSGACETGYVCDKNLAAQNVLPPCREREPVPPPPPKEVRYHLVEDRPSLHNIALGMLLVGIALVVMP